MKSLLRPLLPTFTVVATLLMAGCQTSSLPPVQTEVGAKADFASYHTFAVLPPSGGPSSVSVGDQVRLGAPMRAHLEAQLKARGLQSVAPEQADVLFELVGAVTPQLTLYPSHLGAEIYNRGRFLSRYPLGHYYVPSATVMTTDHGVFSLMALDARSKTVLWAAWIEGDYTPGAKLETVTAALDAMLAQLPVR